jgi:hypothetical protein
LAGVSPRADADRATLEDQLPALVHVLEIGEAEAEWARRARSPAGLASTNSCTTSGAGAAYRALPTRLSMRD